MDDDNFVASRAEVCRAVFAAVATLGEAYSWSFGDGRISDFGNAVCGHSLDGLPNA